MGDVEDLRTAADEPMADLSARPRYSIVTVTYGHRPVTERFLDSLIACYGLRLGADVELVLVDNASPDDTADLLREWEDRATVILNETNLNFAGGNNVGARAARGDVLVLLNNDTELLQPLDALVDQVREPGVAVAGCRLLYPDGTIQHGGCAWAADPAGRILPFHLFQFESGDHSAAHATFDGDVVTGACLAIRSELFHELGGFDELYVNGLEDVDLCVRARLAGHRVVYRGDVAVVHAEGVSRSQRPDDALNQRLFLSRYASMLAPDTDRFAAQFDAVQPDVTTGVRAVWRHPGDSPAGTEVSVEGEVTGLADESSEARALLQAAEIAGLMPTTREWQAVAIIPRHGPQQSALLERGRIRPRRRDALVVQAPVGELGAVEAHPRAILRLAHVPRQDVSSVAAVWAANPNVADALLAAGVDASRIAILPPFVGGASVGTGGGGLLAVLPGHDLERCRQILASVAAHLDSVRVRLLPTIATEGVIALAGQLAAGAEILSPISGEDRFADLASDCDVVVAADPRDRFERRALAAAATGAAVIHLPAGTAAAVLGEELAFDSSRPVVNAALAVTRPADRAARAAQVAQLCGPETIVPQIRELVAQAAARIPRAQALSGARRLAAPQAA